MSNGASRRLYAARLVTSHAPSAASRSAARPQHVVQRGNDRRPSFFAPIDRIRYLDDLRDIARSIGCSIHAYVLMTNHVHLLVTPSRTGQVASMMQALGRRYVRYVNDRYHRTGTLWEARYKACPVDSDHHCCGVTATSSSTPYVQHWRPRLACIVGPATTPMRKANTPRQSPRTPPTRHWTRRPCVVRMPIAHSSKKHSIQKSWMSSDYACNASMRSAESASAP